MPLKYLGVDSRSPPWRSSLPHQSFDLLTRDGEYVHVMLYRAEAHEAFGEQFAGALLEVLRVKVGHHFDDVAAFADVRALVGTDEIADVAQQFIVAVPGGIDELVDGLEHADLAE